MALDFRDYLYLNTQRLEDWASALGPGQIVSLREQTTNETGEGPMAAESFDSPAVVSNRGSEIRERELSVSAKHTFGRVYDALRDQLTVDPTADHSLKRREFIEVTRDFAPSPVNSMLDSLLEVVRLMQSLNVPEMSTTEAQQTLALISVMTDTGGHSRDVPMVASGEADWSLLWSAEPKYTLVTPEDFVGEMTVVGRVRQIVEPGHSLDLLEYLDFLPRTMRRGAAGAKVRSSLIEMFSSWPAEFGTPLDPSSLLLRGPAAIIDPLAAFIG